MSYMLRMDFRVFRTHNLLGFKTTLPLAYIATRLTTIIATACRVATTSQFLLQDGAPGGPAHTILHPALPEPGLGVAQLEGEAHVGDTSGPTGCISYDYFGGTAAGRHHALCNQLCRAAVCGRDSH